MTITAIRPDPRASGCLIIEAGGARLASLPVERVRELDLRSGQEIDQAVAERLDRAIADEAAYRAATRMLTARPRSVAELRLRLGAKGHRPPAAAAAVARLEQAGLLDDALFARHLASVRLRGGYGPSRVLSELLKRGVGRSLAEAAIAAALDEEAVDQRELAEELARRRSRQLRHLPAETRRRRVLGFLARRGFTGAEIRQLVAAVDESE